MTCPQACVRSATCCFAPATLARATSDVCVASLIHMRDMTQRESVRVTWLIHMCDVTHSLACVRSVTRYLARTKSARAASDVCVTWLMNTCDMTHSWVWCDSSLSVCLQCNTLIWASHVSRSRSDVCVTSLIHMCDMTRRERDWERRTREWEKEREREIERERVLKMIWFGNAFDLMNRAHFSYRTYSMDRTRSILW